ncbi:hypothetical protein Amsp01_084860 [Amycolatopsis sp. NBRC 101858]|uniref:DUF4192 domain-containing protein n=1 Tax=Amycolatopsis sp. NBRC 101858 TaxID=3032200 RepID=UPI0024A2292D|nr:DUF4192 domain-containing protein [Amycolatopsis sp. NBRC 101858]GLY42463.1 hypothetical protein Amsp01_084860 [Amycolatopsis sp. NBRC 101858]
MTTATPTGRRPVDLRSPAQLLAALPYLIGFRPANSVLLLGHRAPVGDRLGLVLRGDLPRREDRAHQARALAPRFALAPHTGVTLVVVGGRRRPGSPPPHAGFVKLLGDELGELGLPVLHAMWVQDIDEGAPWGCYADPDCGGELPDPRATVAAAVATGGGSVAFDSRDELESLLAPRSPEALARRAESLARLSSLPWPDATCVAEAASAIRAAFERRLRGSEPPTDEEAVALASALTLPEIRDACLGMAVPPHTPAAREAERLWLTLVQELPAPERAEAATLLGYTAFMRGDGTFAGMALENALAAKPDHVLAGLLKTVLDHGMPPGQLLGLALTADPTGLSGFGLAPEDFGEPDAWLPVSVACGRSEFAVEPG